jgi:GTP-binding protein
VSFRREKYVPRGGPDGGNGGRGGDVILQVSAKRRTLYQFRFTNRFNAANGGHGKGKDKTGRRGRDCIVDVPPGTVVLDAETGASLCDLIEDERRWTAAEGGRGGKGNAHFKSATHRTPRFAQPGEPGQHRTLKLELKLLADVGVVGLPNAGKSTLVSAISEANPKIADYPFTTLHPHLGVVFSRWAEPFVVADIPGLIAGAHRGVGLGIRFLKHVERTRLLIHLIDAAAIDPAAPLDPYTTVNRELHLYSRSLAQKPQLVVLNKIDLPHAHAGLTAFRQQSPVTQTLALSAITREGIDALIRALIEQLDRIHEATAANLL